MRAAKIKQVVPGADKIRVGAPAEPKLKPKRKPKPKPETEKAEK